MSVTDRQLAIPPGLDATFVLVRHGESTWVAEGRVQGGADPPLSPLGERQVALVASRLVEPQASPALPVPGGRPQGCWHSPLRRAAATAAPIAERWVPALQARPDERLREIGQGEWEGLTGAEVRARYRDVRAGWRRDPVQVHAPGGESLQHADARARSFVADLLGMAAASGGQRASPPEAGSVQRGPWMIVVAHEGILRVLVLALLDLPLDAFWRFPFGLCGVSVVEIRNRRPALRAHNLLEHLAPLGPGADIAATQDRGGTL